MNRRDFIVRISAVAGLPVLSGLKAFNSAGSAIPVLQPKPDNISRRHQDRMTLCELLCASSYAAHFDSRVGIPAEKLYDAMTLYVKTPLMRDDTDARQVLLQMMDGTCRAELVFKGTRTFQWNLPAGRCPDRDFIHDSCPLRAIEAEVLSPNLAPYSTAWVPLVPCNEGNHAFVEPQVAFATPCGMATRISPDWLSAPVETLVEKPSKYFGVIYWQLESDIGEKDVVYSLTRAMERNGQIASVSVHRRDGVQNV